LNRLKQQLSLLLFFVKGRKIFVIRKVWIPLSTVIHSSTQSNSTKFFDFIFHNVFINESTVLVWALLPMGGDSRSLYRRKLFGLQKG
jgi:hypothetical protein